MKNAGHSCGNGKYKNTEFRTHTPQTKDTTDFLWPAWKTEKTLKEEKASKKANSDVGDNVEELIMNIFLWQYNMSPDKI